MIADLHVHTQFSDGTMTPGEVVSRAAETGVSLLAVADHNVMAGSEAIAPLCRAAGIGYIPAVEIDCVYRDRFYHVLAYGVDFSDVAFAALVHANREKLDRMSDDLVEVLARTDERISVEDYRAFERDPRVGGWKGIEYLWRRGVTGGLKQGMGLYEQHGVTYEQAGFPGLDALARAVHAAGGRAVLAHPGERIVRDDRDAFLRQLTAIMDQGLDGIECYYPTHPDWMTAMCLNLCGQRGLMITAGSDCHGAFGHTDVGEMAVPVDKLRLNGLRVR